MNDKLSIKKLNVTINVIRVGGQKMTKALFRQIPLIEVVPDDMASEIKKESAFDSNYISDMDLNTCKLLGWVNDTNRKWLVFYFKGELFRTRLDQLITQVEIEQVYIAT